MKNKIKFMLAGILCAGLLTIIGGSGGCSTSQNTVAYKTLYGVEVATTGAYDGYIKLVIANTLPTNDVPVVSKTYNVFQSSMSIAVLAARGDSNAIAPANVIADGDAVVNLISTIKSK